MFTMGRSGHRTGRDVPTERKGDASCTTGAWGDKFRRSEALLNRWPRPSLRQKKHCRGGDSSRRATAKSVAIERPSGDGGTTSPPGDLPVAGPDFELRRLQLHLPPAGLLFTGHPAAIGNLIIPAQRMQATRARARNPAIEDRYSNSRG